MDKRERVSVVFILEEWKKPVKDIAAICNEEWCHLEPVLRNVLSRHISDEADLENALKEIYQEDEYHGEGFVIYVESYILNDAV